MKNVIKTWLSDNIIVVFLVALSPVWTFYEFIFQHEMPRWIFVIAVFALVFVTGYLVISGYQQKRGYAKELEEKTRSLFKQYQKEEYQKKQGGYAHTKDGIEYDYQQLIKQSVTHMKIRVVICIVLLGILCWKNPSHVEAFGKWVTQQDPNDEEMEEIANNGSDMVLKPQGYRFVLNRPDYVPKLEEEIRDQVYFYTDGNGKEDADSFAEYIQRILSLKQEGIAVGELEDTFGNTFYTYTAAEDAFKNDVNKFCNTKYLDAWYEKAPQSDELEMYVYGREALCLVVKDGKQGCYELYWKLANDYQYIAQEYEAQTQNQRAIWYYYTMSIHYCIEALKYDMELSDYIMIYNYMRTRYQDIARNEANIPYEYKMRAQELLAAISDYKN